MSEARKLDEQFTTEREPLILEAVPKLVLATPKTSQPSRRLTLRRVERIDNASKTALILFVIGFVAFVAGIAFASVILLGILDLQTGWVKDVLAVVKGLARQVNEWLNG